MIYGVILAGGRGERFWPLSRHEHPKQLLKLTSDKTMIEETIGRLDDFIAREKIIVVTGDHLKDKIKGVVSYLSDDNFLLEPEGKNTCLAIGLAAAHIIKEDPDGVMVVLSSDHLIAPREKLISLLKAGSEMAARGDHLLTIGVVPNRAETAYGYIELGDEFSSIAGIKFYDVKRFKEKPSPVKAQEYYLDRQHLWNSGMFIWRADSILKALEKYEPDIYNCLVDYMSEIDGDNIMAAREKLYCECTSISIDFAIMEKASNVLTMRGDIRWDDIGSWLAMDRIHRSDNENNVAVGDILLDESFENIVVNDAKGVIVGFGVSDLVIVRTGDIVMVAHKTKVGEIKELLSNLSENEKYEKYL
ncbi:MAG: sugar phosphate nucleotidyltransferase [candidate division Zixibacteria bacterium]